MVAPISLIKTIIIRLHKHFEPQQVDVVVSPISILGLECLNAFPQTHPLSALTGERGLWGIHIAADEDTSLQHVLYSRLS